MNLINKNSININFSAKYIADANILQKAEKGSKYLPKKVSFIEIEPDYSEDRDIIKKISSKWKKNGDTFSDYIRVDIMRKFEEKEGTESKRFFAVINDEKSNNIKINNVLGLIQLEEKPLKKNVYIDYLQVNPAYIKKEKNIKYPDFRNIGVSLIYSVQKLFNDSLINLTATYNSFNFYNKIGFDFVGEYLKFFLELNKEKFSKYLKRKNYLKV